MSATRYSTRDAAVLSGATFRQVDYWVRLGFMTCAQPASGSGSRRRFDERDLFVVRALAVASDAMSTDGDRNNVPGPVLRAVARRARKVADRLPESELQYGHGFRTPLRGIVISVMVPAIKMKAAA